MYHIALKNTKGQTSWPKQPVLALQSTTLCQLGAPFISAWKKKHITKRLAEEFWRRKERRCCLPLFIYFSKGGIRPDSIPIWVCILVILLTGIWHGNGLRWTWSIWMEDFTMFWVNARLPLRIVGLQEDLWATESSFSHYEQALSYNQ